MTQTQCIGRCGEDCPLKPTMAIRTTAPSALRTQIFWDPEDAPKVADLLCHIHGPRMLADLASTLGREQ